MKRAEAIIAEAKMKMVEFICFEAPLLYKKLGLAEPEKYENYSINGCDFPHPIFINVEVDNSYLGVEACCFEEREVTEVLVSRDNEVWICTEDEEYTIDEISVDDLAAVTNAIEAAYLKGE